MRILVHEQISSEGSSGSAYGPSLRREGATMLSALLADLARLPGHRLLTTAAAGSGPHPPPGVETRRAPLPGELGPLLQEVDAVWLIAPESHGCLAALAGQVERAGRSLLGPGSAAIELAADKARLARLLHQAGVMVPDTEELAATDDPFPPTRRLGYPVVVKPARGAGCQGVGVARSPEELPAVVARARAVERGGSVVLQRRVAGTHASVAVLADGRDAVPLVVSSQRIRMGARVSYHGGETPLEHPLAALAAETAREACRAVQGLRGYVGVDLVLTGAVPVVVEINPRLTTSYLGVRMALEANPAELALLACAGELRPPPPVRRRVRFSALGALAPVPPAL